MPPYFKALDRNSIEIHDYRSYGILDIMIWKFSSFIKQSNN